MKISKNYLKQIIKEELEKELSIGDNAPDENYDPIGELFNNSIEISSGNSSLNEGFGLISIPLIIVAIMVGGGLLAAKLKGDQIRELEDMKASAESEMTMLIETLTSDRMLLRDVERFVALTIFLEPNVGKRSKELAAMRKEHKMLSKKITSDIEKKSEQYIQSQPDPKSSKMLIRLQRHMKKTTERDIRNMLKDLAKQNLEREDPGFEQAELTGKELKKDANLQKRRKAAARRKAARRKAK